MSDESLPHLTRGTLTYVGYDVPEPIWAFHVFAAGGHGRRSDLDRLRSYLARLDALPILPVSDLVGYDRRYRLLTQSA